MVIMDQNAQIIVPVIQRNVSLMDIPTVKWDGVGKNVIRISTNVVKKISAATVTVQTLLAVLTVPVLRMCMV